MRMSLSKGLWVAAGGVLAASVLMACTANGAADRATAEPDKIGPTCLDAQRTGRFHVVDEHTLLVYDRSDNAYKLDIGGPCRQRQHPERHQGAGEVDERLDGVGQQTDRAGHLPCHALEQNGGNGRSDGNPGVTCQRRWQC